MDALRGLQRLASRLFELSPTNELIAGPIVGEEAIYVIAFNQRIPSEIPPFDQVQERVAADYKFGQALSKARAAGLEFAQSVSNGLAQGKTFSEICAEAKVTPITLPPFSISTQEMPEVEDKLSLMQLKNIAFRTTPGRHDPKDSQRTHNVSICRERLVCSRELMLSRIN